MPSSFVQKMMAAAAIASMVLSQAPFAAQSVPPPAASAANAMQDAGWPRQIEKKGTMLVYYQPQIDDWKNYRHLDARAAFSLTPADGKTVMGVTSVQAETVIDKDSRTVYLHNLKYTSVRFPSLDAQHAPQMEQLFRTTAPTGVEPVALDRLMADVDRGKIQAQTPPLRNDPPQIFYSGSPAVLLMVEGQPVLSPISKTDLQFVVNTNWDLFYEKSKKRYYLLVNSTWLTATDLKGPWTVTGTLPKDMSKLPEGQNWDEVKKVVPPPASQGYAPQVFFSTVPAELILLRGGPVYTRIPETHLLYVTNTDNDLFLDDAENQYYVLLSGRWFRSSAFSGPWNYAGNNLPADFAKIPENSSKGHVLASVPGTTEASDAVMLAQIPTTVTVNRVEAEAKAKVSYNGPPQFKPIEQTKLDYATNTQEKVIKDGDLFYLCFQGVWFMSTNPNGPWKTADSVPKEIYTIPPSSPVYNVTYVTQANPTPTTVESSTTAGYMGMLVLGMAAGFAIAYGTGYYYPPYVYWGPGALYPVYHPWPATYGAGAVYNPWTGGWAAGRSVYGPYGAAGSSAWYNPATGRYGRSASVQGWYGGRTVASSYNPWTGAYGRTSQGYNAYSQWGGSVVSRNGQWAQTGHISTASGTIAGYRTSTGQHGAVRTGTNGTVVRGNGNAVYAGKDGNVYRHNSNGSWSQYNNGSWNSVNTSANRQQAQQNFQANHPQAQQNTQAARQNFNSRGSGADQHISENTLQGLDRSSAARQRGQIQTQRFQNFHRGGGEGGFRFHR